MSISSRDERRGSTVLRPLTVTLKTTRHLLGIGNTKLYELINEGVIRTIKVGPRRLTIYASLEELTSLSESPVDKDLQATDAVAVKNCHSCSADRT